MKRNYARSILSLFSAVLVCAACASEQDAPVPGAGTATATASPTLEVATELGVRNARMPRPGMLSGAQITEDQLTGLSDAGFRHFISLRPTAEDGAGWEEAFSSSAGYDFERLPIEGAASLTRENVESFARMLEATDGEATVLYCASGNRVGAMLALKAHWIDGAPPEEALELGLAAGMTRLTDPVRQLLGLESAP